MNLRIRGLAMSNQSPKAIMRHPYERVLIPEQDGGYSAYISEFDGCLAEGETSEEALKNLESTALAWIEAEQEAGREIPEARNSQEYSGKLLLRLPKGLHQKIARCASENGVSLNQYVVTKLAERATEDRIASIFAAVISREGMVPLFQPSPGERDMTKKETLLNSLSLGVKAVVKVSKSSFSHGRDAQTGQLMSAPSARRSTNTSQVERMPKPGYGSAKKK